MKRALIELDGAIRTGFCGQYETWKDKYLPEKDMGTFFDTIITDAYENKVKVWDAIIQCDEIWVDSSYVGDSGRLLVKMLDNADKFHIKDKKLINMNDYSDVCWHIPEDAKVLIKRLKSNNIEFIYADDIEYKNHTPK
jgi:hypothetical protein